MFSFTYYSLLRRKQREQQKPHVIAPCVSWAMAVLKGIIRSIYHNCSGDYRDARALIGRELHHKLSCYNHPEWGDYNWMKH